MTDRASTKVGWRTTIPYGVGAMATAGLEVPITTFLMLYYNEVLRLPAIAVSSVLMVSLMLDAVFDPLMGHISDNFRSRLGRRLPFMYASALPAAALFIMLWIPPAGLPQWELIVYLAFCLIGLRFVDTVFYLPHIALIPELAPEYNARTKLFTIRYFFQALGGAGVGLLAYNYFMKEKPNGTGGLLSAQGYPAFAWFTGAFIFVTILVCCIGLHRQLTQLTPPVPRKVSAAKMFREILATLNSRSFAVLIATGFFISVGSGIGSSLSLYMTLYIYQFSQAQLSLLIAPVMLGTFGMGAAPLLGRRFGKRNAALLLCWIYVVTATIPLLARVLDWLPAKSTALFGLVMVQTAIAPAAMTMVLIMLSSMISDLVEDAEVRTGRRSEGLLLAANSLVRKATQGLGTLGAGVILTIVAFPKGAERTAVPQIILNHLALLYLAVTFALFVATTVSLLFYRHDRAAHEANLQKLADRAEARGIVDEATIEAAKNIADPQAEAAIIGQRIS